MLPTTIKLKPEDAKAVKQLELDQVSLQQFVDQVVDSGKRKVAQHREKHASIWEGISQKYGIDVKSIFWEFNSETGEIVPKQMMLNQK
jgi:hypothetical protein